MMIRAGASSSMNVMTDGADGQEDTRLPKSRSNLRRHPFANTAAGTSMVPAIKNCSM